MGDRLNDLLARLHTADDLDRAAAVLGWDQMTYMPPEGNAGRGDQLATLATLWHREFTSPAIGELLDALETEYKDRPADDPKRALLHVTRRQYEKKTKLPESLVAEMQRASAEAYKAWVAARAEKRFSLFAPAFGRILQLNRDAAEAFGYAEEPYDALIDDAEPGLTASRAQQLLDALKQALLPLVQQIAEHRERVDRSMLIGEYPHEAQWQAGIDAATAFGFDFARGRQDVSIHPFTTSFGVDDVRITTHINPGFFPSGFYSTLHEAGHGMYEQGLPAEWARTPLGQAISGGVHESQSRLWENVVGRSHEFWEYFLPTAKRYFPTQLGHADVETMYRAVNYSEPSLVRVDADEVTYNLHIAVRFEIERALMQGNLTPQDVPDAWAQKMQTYLGIRPHDDLVGALQDIHWTGGFGSFIGYSIGNIVSGQLWQAASRDLGDLPDMIRRGEFAPLLGWLRTNLHQLGRTYSTDQMLRRATGGPLDAAPYIDYVQRKYRAIYGL
ncbi:MAG: carboxypeptidase M32 [Thermaerobacter sp.]|nr:carboxypeptidase M32 [Thermaerobacter sp.]